MQIIAWCRSSQGPLRSLRGFCGQSLPGCVGVLTPSQYGFSAGYSMAMAMLDMVVKVRGAWGRGNAALEGLYDYTIYTY